MAKGLSHVNILFTVKCVGNNISPKITCLLETLRMCIQFLPFFFQQSQQMVPGRQQTITIHDTPSPAVSVITISDSEDEAPGKW